MTDIVLCCGETEAGAAAARRADTRPSVSSDQRPPAAEATEDTEDREEEEERQQPASSVPVLRPECGSCAVSLSADPDSAAAPRDCSSRPWSAARPQLVARS